MDVYAREEDGWTLLMRAAYNGELRRVKTLIAAGADVNATDKDGWTGLMFAAFKGTVDILQDLSIRSSGSRQRNVSHALSHVRFCLTSKKAAPGVRVSLGF